MYLHILHDNLDFIYLSLMFGQVIVFKMVNIYYNDKIDKRIMST